MPRDALLALPAELTIYAVGELRPAWLAWLAGATPADSVDGHAVDEVDAAGVQMLIALQRALVQRALQLRLRDPSPALTAACSALGLADWLQACSAAASDTTEEARA